MCKLHCFPCISTNCTCLTLGVKLLWLQSLKYLCCFCNFVARHGGVEVAGWTVDQKIGFDSWHTLTMCGPSDGKEFKDVFKLPGAVSGKVRHAKDP